MTDDEAIAELRSGNRSSRERGMFFAWSAGSGFMMGYINPALPRGVIWDGLRYLDVLYPEERACDPLPSGWRIVPGFIDVERDENQ